ncbi:MAG: PAS domain-containing sensor histidine kinase [Deltaproteobacteria bacterium]|nr:PAS domain-containing sensor histidine kinase [Deltaproteobacteria bacterium]
MTLDPRQSETLLFEATSDAIFSVDLDSGRILTANARLEELTGHPLDALIGGWAVLLTPGESLAHTTPFGPDVWRCAGLHEEVAVARADGFVACVTLRVAHPASTDQRLAICVVRDDTERRMLERELITKHLALRSAHQELERRVEELRKLSAILEDRKREIGELSARMATVSRRAMLAEVVAEVAHSMNNPLAAVVSSVRMLGRSVETISDEETRERTRTLVTRCREACTRMTQAVEDIRLASRSGAAAPKEADFDLGAEIEAAVSLLAHRLGPGIQVELALEPGVRARAVADEVHHALLNVLDNALQAIGSSGTIRVECRSVDWPFVEVTVSDSGPGIDPTVAASVFEPFFTTKPKGRGTGLGLSMVRRILTRCGGTVEVEPKGSLGGATFRMRLKRENTDGAEKPSTDRR